MKTAPFLTFQRNKRHGWYEFQFMAQPFVGGIINKFWPDVYHAKHRKGKHKWAVYLDEDQVPLFIGSLNDCKKFVRLMWESHRAHY